MDKEKESNREMCLNSRTCTCVRFSGLEVFARIVTACEALAVLESIGSAQPVEQLRRLHEHFQIDDGIRALLPNAANVVSYRQKHAALLNARPSILPWLLLKTYSDHPPTAVEAYRFLKLGNIQNHLERLSSVLRVGALYIDHQTGTFDTDRFIERQNKQVEFLLESLVQYGIEAETYAEAVKQYVALLDSVFPAAVRTNDAAGNVELTITAVQ
jgi:hypothetical protein